MDDKEIYNRCVDAVASHFGYMKDKAKEHAKQLIATGAAKWVYGQVCEEMRLDGHRVSHKRAVKIYNVLDN